MRPHNGHTFDAWAYAMSVPDDKTLWPEFAAADDTLTDEERTIAHRVSERLEGRSSHLRFRHSNAMYPSQVLGE